MPEAVYILCAVTSIVVAALLLRGYRASRTGLLFWSSACFIGLAINNVLLFLDLVVTGPSIDLRFVRHGAALLSMLVLLYGLASEESE
jgi:hypothetical protein